MEVRRVEVDLPDYLQVPAHFVSRIQRKLLNAPSVVAQVEEEVESEEHALVLALLTIILLVLIVSLARVIFARINVSRLMPESGVVVLLGCVLGVVLLIGDTASLQFNTEIFFLILVPPIIWEAGFVMDKTYFFNNVGLILLYAVVGTLLNTTFTGGLLYLVRDYFGVSMQNISIYECLTFGALISAVDPVGVLSIFEEAKVNETLNMLVFGESVLNDAVSIVIYDLFFALSDSNQPLDGTTLLHAVLEFLRVSVGGLVIGVVGALICAGVTRFASGHLNLLNPLFMFVFAYMCYLGAEIMKVSGIVAILFCGVVQEQYCEDNLSRAVKTTLHVLMKLVASTAEAIIFLYLGLTTVFLFTGFAQSEHGPLVFYWDWGLTLCTLVFILVLRVIISLTLTKLGNSCRTPADRIPLRDMIVISYGGIRGAIAFALSLRLTEGVHLEHVNQLITTTLAVIWFTMFIQGNTVKPLLTLLRTERAKERSTTEDVTTKVLSAALEPFTQVVAAIAGRERSFLKEWTLRADRRIKKLLIRDYNEQPTLASALLQLQESRSMMKKTEVDETPDPVALCPNCSCQFIHTSAAEVRVVQPGRQVIAASMDGGAHAGGGAA